MENSTRSSEFYVQGRRLLERRWPPCSGSPASIVYVCHGFADHCGFFDKMADRLTDAGYLVVGHDFYGHGGSEGDVRDVRRFDEFVRDTQQHLQRIRAEFPALPIHGFGYSMGALVLHRVAGEAGCQLASQLWISPSLQPCGVKVTRKMVRCLKRLAGLAPKLPVPGATFKAGDITRDPEARSQLKSDPSIRQRRLTIRLMSLTLEAMLQTTPAELSTPLLVTVGTDDALADAEQSLNFVKESQKLGLDANVVTFTDCKHQLHTDALSQFCECALNWLGSK